MIKCHLGFIYFKGAGGVEVSLTLQVLKKIR